jgi:AcrR family transcriptional regulator
MVDENSHRRKYELRKRADAMAATRQRITEAAMELHGSVGPARTTVTAVADRAGVQRHTVYRHFPTDRDLFAACSAHFEALHPAPDLTAWAAEPDPDARLRRGLSELYAWYEGTRAMWANVFRDEPLVEALRPSLRPFLEYLDEAARVLGAGRPRRKVVTAALRHAVDFRTWESLVTEGGVSRADAVRLAAAMVEGAA